MHPFSRQFYRSIGRVVVEVPRLTHPALLHCLFCGMVLDLEAVLLTSLTRFLSDLSLDVAGDDFRFCSVFEADINGES